MHDGAIREEESSEPSNRKRRYVIDTNVLIIDPNAVISFKEHDVVICKEVIAELSKLKKGKGALPYSAREALHVLDKILNDQEDELENGISLEKYSGGTATGRFFFDTKVREEIPEDFPLKGQIKAGSVDCTILLAAFMQQKELEDTDVIIVSKDIDMRLFGSIAHIPVEQYRKDRVIEDADLLPTGETEIPENFWGNPDYGNPSSPQKLIKISGEEAIRLPLNEYVFSEANRFYARVIAKGDNEVTLREVRNYLSEKNQIYGIHAINRQQVFAMDAIMDRETDCLIMPGKAGSGKTIIALAGACEQVIEQKLYEKIIYTCAAVDLDEGHGFLPGDEEEKMDPRVGGLKDNLGRLHGGKLDSDKYDQKNKEAGRATWEYFKNFIEIKAFTFMRGRSIQNSFIIVDEAQNMTASQVRAMASRVGEGSKIVFLGNLAQIDTPYLTEGTCGLAHLVTGLKGLPGCVSLILPSGVRSRIANYANEYL